MQDKFYFEKQTNDSKLIYALGFLWGDINDKIDKALKQYDLNSAKFNILMIIKQLGKENGVQQNFISDKLLVTPSNITKMLDKLEKDELITRNDKKNDRRVKIIKITDKGIALLDKVWGEYLKLIKTLSPKISEKSKEDLLSVLIDWQNNI